jgi:hypothetical protein
MTPSERNFSITEKECLALVWVVKKFRQFILGCPIKIVTDHHASAGSNQSQTWLDDWPGGR